MKLSSYLKKRGESASDFARRIHCTRSTVSRLLDGSRYPSFAMGESIRRETRGEVMPADFLRAKRATDAARREEIAPGLVDS